jgi:membrane-associated phospholipid phosphatase
MTVTTETGGSTAAGDRPVRADAGAPVLEPRRGGFADRLAARAQGHHPVTVFVAVMLAGYLALSGLTMLLGLLLLDVVLPFDGLGHDDEHVNVVLAAHRSGLLNTASDVMSKIADVYAIPAVVAVTALAAAARRHWRIVGFVLAAIAVEAAAYRVTTLVIERHRPRVAHLDQLPMMASFPSGHVAASVAVFVGVALVITSRFRNRALRTLCWTLALAIPPLVALARIYRGMHHPSDTIAGMLVGIGALLVALAAARCAGAVAERHQRQRPA